MNASPTEEPAFDLGACEREPIHIPGAVQPHGVLLGLRGDVVAIASDNAAAHLGIGASALLGRTIDGLFDAPSAAHLRACAASVDPRDASPLKLFCTSSPGIRAFDGIAHRVRDLLVLELEPAVALDSVSFVDFYHYVRAAMVGLQSSGHVVVDLCQLAANEVRALTGFDRVMVYRFDENWNGEVIAESRSADVDSFLGLHFPASDIPPQARALYTVDWLRLIVTASYRPALLVADESASAAGPLDLSRSVLRSVSPVHLEYLRNMGVGASMSTSLIDDGKLWGLILCHHREPRFVPYELRTASEFLGQALSWQVAERGQTEETARRAETTSRYARLVEQMATRDDVVEGLLHAPETLLSLVGADGAAVWFGGRCWRIGRTPGEAEVAELVGWVSGRFVQGVFSTDRLPSLYEPAAYRVGEASGVLGIALSQSGTDMVLWFRGEFERTVDWAGDPRKAVRVEGTGPTRLGPRASFGVWRESVRGQSRPWRAWEVAAATELRPAVLEALLYKAAGLARLNAELQAASNAKDEFLAMVSHELRTPLNAMVGWLALLQSDSLTEPQREKALDTVQRNAQAQTQLIDDLLDVSRIVSGKLRLDVRSVDLHAVVLAAIDVVRPAAAAKGVLLQSVLDNGSMPIDGDPNRLQQIVWNLLANAVKFSPRDGRVLARLQRNASDVEIVVADNGMGIARDFLPHVFERFRQADALTTRSYGGLGLGLAIVKNLVELHGGTVEVTSEGKAKGSTFVVRLPISPARDPLAERRNDHPKARDTGALECLPELAGLRVLVVDDEPDARELLVALLGRCGVLVRVAESALDAFEQVRTWRPDVMVSDIGMPELDGYELIRRVRALPTEEGGDTPAVALTAYARADDRTRVFQSGFQAHVPKPVAPSELFAVVASLGKRLSIT